MLELGCLCGVIVVRGEAEMPRLLCLVGVPRVEEVAVSDSDREITPHETPLQVIHYFALPFYKLTSHLNHSL